MAPLKCDYTFVKESLRILFEKFRSRKSTFLVPDDFSFDAFRFKHKSRITFLNGNLFENFLFVFWFSLLRKPLKLKDFLQTKSHNYTFFLKSLNVLQ